MGSIFGAWKGSWLTYPRDQSSWHHEEGVRAYLPQGSIFGAWKGSWLTYPRDQSARHHEERVRAYLPQGSILVFFEIYFGALRKNIGSHFLLRAISWDPLENRSGANRRANREPKGKEKEQVRPCPRSLPISLPISSFKLIKC